MLALHGLVLLSPDVLVGWPAIAAHAKNMQDSENRQLISIVGLELGEGLRSRKDWVEEYLSLSFPFSIARVELGDYCDALKTKLLRTGVFEDATVAVSDRGILQIDLKEKWTTIPVFRGEFGGGTPLRVLGIYDTHSFGKLWTIGGEFRQYGTEDPGYVLFAKNPRYGDGRRVLGYELWADKRKRTFLNEKFEPVGELSTEVDRFRFEFLHPIRGSIMGDWLDNVGVGLDVQYRQVKPNLLTPLGLSPPDWQPDGISLDKESASELWLQPTLLYDDIDLYDLNLSGLRLIAKPGVTIQREDHAQLYELEAFYFKDLFDLNFAAHSLLFWSNLHSIAGTRFLGGFESIRGIPDGALYGSIAGYTNLEVRRVEKKTKYLWFQSVFFLDFGSAASRESEIAERVASSFGAGLRLAVPQVYRLMLRIDFAWSISHPGSQGLSIGLNHFFQPHKPL